MRRPMVEGRTTRVPLMRNRSEAMRGSGARGGLRDSATIRPFCVAPTAKQKRSTTIPRHEGLAATASIEDGLRRLAIGLRVEHAITDSEDLGGPRQAAMAVRRRVAGPTVRGAADVIFVPVSYTHLTLPTIYSV